MCASGDFASGSASCASVQTPSTTANAGILAIPSAKSVSDAIYLICNEMPMMEDCKTCPSPSAATGLSDCPLLDTWSKLCLSMPEMSNCGKFESFCKANPASSFCGSSSASGSAAAASTVLQSSYCTEGNQVCVNATYTSASETCFSVSTSAEGWVAIGMGTSVMAGSDMVIAWTRDDGSLAIGNFAGTGPVQPSFRSDQSSLTSSKLVQAKSSSSRFQFQFCRTNSVSKISVTAADSSSSPSTPFLYAWGTKKPVSSDSSAPVKSATILQHDGGYDAFIFPKPQLVAVGDSSSTIALSDDICSQMPSMTSCAARKSEGSALSPSVAYATICTDMPSMSACSTFNKTCPKAASASSSQSCQPLANFPSTSSVTRAIYSICSQMYMPGCSSCSSAITSANQTYASCPLLATYSNLCLSMPEMRDCKMFSAMCTSTPSLSYCSSSSNLSPPEMKMYFHTGILDYILFESWVPRTSGAYAGALFAIFVVSFLSKGVEVASGHWEAKWKIAYLEKKRQGGGGKQGGFAHDQKQRMVVVVENGSNQAATGQYENNYKDQVASENSQDTAKGRGRCHLFFSQFCWKTAILRALLQCLSVSLHFGLMLLVMTFNAGIVIVVILGLTLGSVVFTPLSYELESHAAATPYCH